uniref:Leucine-rich repeat-containing protein 51 n=1 Tax=Craspedostauros australis TaxID=1486917 RepID=A0A7R9WVZ8_9STRA|mmetsp:Transcript_20145/g.56102  ORF Transcript_20145/g.56102 Transcript_20145/m.56102 type:complete len:233 (+) Transcript_20145:1206-1904(+)
MQDWRQNPTHKTTTNKIFCFLVSFLPSHTGADSIPDLRWASGPNHTNRTTTVTTMTTMATNNEDAPANNKSDDEREQFIALLHANIAPSVDFTTLTKLNLPNCGLSSLPACMPSVLPNLSILFMPNNQFEELPAILGSCLQLQMVSFKNNGMRSIHPDALQSQLRWLILTGNAIHQIPDTIGRCRRLQKWMLSGNQLTQLPEAVQQLDNLELIRLACNRLQEVGRVVQCSAM